MSPNHPIFARTVDPEGGYLHRGRWVWSLGNDLAETPALESALSAVNTTKPMSTDPLVPWSSLVSSISVAAALPLASVPGGGEKIAGIDAVLHDSDCQSEQTSMRSVNRKNCTLMFALWFRQHD